RVARRALRGVRGDRRLHLLLRDRGAAHRDVAAVLRARRAGPRDVGAALRLAVPVGAVPRRGESSLGAAPLAARDAPPVADPRGRAEPGEGPARRPGARGGAGRAPRPQGPRERAAPLEGGTHPGLGARARRPRPLLPSAPPDGAPPAARRGRLPRDVLGV